MIITETATLHRASCHDADILRLPLEIPCLLNTVRRFRQNTLQIHQCKIILFKNITDIIKEIILSVFVIVLVKRARISMCLCRTERTIPRCGQRHGLNEWLGFLRLGRLDFLLRGCLRLHCLCVLHDSLFFSLLLGHIHGRCTATKQ